MIVPGHDDDDDDDSSDDDDDSSDDDDDENDDDGDVDDDEDDDDDDDDDEDDDDDDKEQRVVELLPKESNTTIISENTNNNNNENNDKLSAIKIINLDLDENETDSTNLGIVEINEMSASILEKNMEISDDDIVIHKIENVDNAEVIPSSDNAKDNKDIYKKMSLSFLKTTAIEKGLSTDPSKLKKHELIKLLESADSL